MASGYISCACRDCFEVAIASNDETDPAMCSLCEEAGCDASGESECQGEHAYGGADAESEA